MPLEVGKHYIMAVKVRDSCKQGPVYDNLTWQGKILQSKGDFFLIQCENKVITHAEDGASYTSHDTQYHWMYSPHVVSYEEITEPLVVIQEIRRIKESGKVETGFKPASVM